VRAYLAGDSCVTPFGEYARYYDLLYADKDYAAETAFVREIIRRLAPGARTLLELGCGSARHAVELVRSDFTVTGVDLSAQMIARAQASLFHVINYQTTNDALSGIFRSARAALETDGIFIFDFWYGPAVLSEHPQVRIKRINIGQLSLTRIAEPNLDINRNVVDVNYTLIVVDRAGKRVEEIKEVHSVRYLFLPEIELLAAANGFEITESGEWLTGNPLHPRSWSGYAVARPTPS